MDFQVNLNILGWFLACVLLESFIKFLVNPYYEPLLWFMMRIFLIFWWLTKRVHFSILRIITSNSDKQRSTILRG